MKVFNIRVVVDKTYYDIKAPNQDAACDIALEAEKV